MLMLSEKFLNVGDLGKEFLRGVKEIPPDFGDSKAWTQYSGGFLGPKRSISGPINRPLKPTPVDLYPFEKF